MSTDAAVTTQAVEEPRDLPHMPVGRVGMWWFLASEVMVFGGLIGSYILNRIANGGWAPERAHVNAKLAAINTLVLLTSSLTVVLSLQAVHDGQRQRARSYLLVTVLFGLTFLGIKFVEYSNEIHHGFTPASGPFWSYYYIMTGLHGLHVIGGMIANFWIWLMLGGVAWRAIEKRVEYVGLYWHFVDVVWIFLFPLLYLS